MALIHRVGWVWTLEENVTRFYVTNLVGRVGLNPNMIHPLSFFIHPSFISRLLSFSACFFIELFPNKKIVKSEYFSNGIRHNSCLFWNKSCI